MDIFPLRLRVVLAGATAVALLASMVGPAEARPSHAGGVLIWADETTSLWPKTLDPALATDTQSQQIIQLLYSGLVKLDGNNNVVPDLAASMPKISPDRLTYTFTLRPNLKFSDGTPLTSADVVYSLSRSTSKQEASPLSASLYLNHIKGVAAWNAGKAANLAGVKALDARTVQITLDKPIGFFLQTLTYPTSYVVKPSLAAGADLVGPTAQSRNVGAGPWTFNGSWRYRQEMDFKPNPYWYNASKMKLSELRVPFITTPDVNYREYLAGQQPVTIVPSAHVPSDRKLPDYHQSPVLSIDYMTPNQGKNSACKPLSCAPFNDIHFRRALMYAIDRTTITQKILHGTETPLCGIVPKGIHGYDPSLCSLTPYDPAKAKAELALAKKDFGGKLPNEGNFSVIYQGSSQDITNEYQELQSEWNAVGININITAVPFNHWLDLVSTNYTPFLENAWIDDYPDAQDFTENLFSIHSPYNVGNYNNPAFERLIAQANVTPNGPDRDKLYVKAQQMLINDVAFIMVGQNVYSYRWKTNIHGLFAASSYIWPQPANEDWTNVSVS